MIFILIRGNKLVYIKEWYCIIGWL